MSEKPRREGDEAEVVDDASSGRTASCDDGCASWLRARLRGDEGKAVAPALGLMLRSLRVRSRIWRSGTERAREEKGEEEPGELEPEGGEGEVGEVETELAGGEGETEREEGATRTSEMKVWNLRGADS